MTASTREQIDCNEVVEVVTDYLERALAEDERRLVEKHLAECEGCETYVAQMRQTVTALRGVQGQAVEVDMEILMATFRARTADG
jgi:anti-sigma factor RsiW